MADQGDPGTSTLVLVAVVAAVAVALAGAAVQMLLFGRIHVAINGGLAGAAGALAAMSYKRSRQANAARRVE